MRAAVRVVFQTLYPGRDAVLLPPPIDHAVVMLVTAALVAHRDRAVVVAPVHLRLRSRERPVRIALVELGRDHLDESASARGRRLDFDQRHGWRFPLFRGGEVDFLALGEPHIGFLPAALAPDAAAEAA